MDTVIARRHKQTGMHDASMVFLIKLACSVKSIKKMFQYQMYLI